MKKYKVYDAEDSNYATWYGTAIEIAEYFDEHQDQIPEFDKYGSIFDNAKRYGLVVQEV